VVGSSNWNANRGAATWGNGSTGITGTISFTNILVGSTVGDEVSLDYLGQSGITALTNGNYVVASGYWDNGSIVDAGAATWGNGSTGISGTISSTNSLIGSTANDGVGNFGITTLTNGNYVVSSYYWDNGTIADAGAVTWGNGSTGISGIVSTINSLTGSVSNDWYPRYPRWYMNIHLPLIIGLSNGNYLMSHGAWDNAGLVDAGQVRIVTPQNNNGIGQTMTFNPSTIADTLALGTNVTLQASNDITLKTGADIIVGGNNGGAFTLQAGRNINLNSRIVTANGNFTAIAGDPNAIAADRDAGTPTITLGSGATINAGKGKVILAAIGGNFVNNSGSTAPITANQWLVYSTDPGKNSRNGMVADFKHYAQPYTGVTPSYATAGDWFLYSITPVLTVTPNSQTVTTGRQIASFTPNFTGFIDGDTKDTAGINGTAIFGIENFTNTRGSYNVAYLKGLASKLGYTFVDNTASVNELTVEKTPIFISIIAIINARFNFNIHYHDYYYRNHDGTEINVFNLANLLKVINNFGFSQTQTTSLQSSTTFLNWYQERISHNHDEIDDDFGQYKDNDNSWKTESYEWRREHGKKHWYEKKHHDKGKIKLKDLYDALLFFIENDGIKVPEGLIKFRSTGSNSTDL